LADSGIPGTAPEAPGEEELRRRLRNFALRLTGDPHQAEDVAQETLARALVPGTPRELPYLFSIALNLVRTGARKAARRRPAPRPVEQIADPRSMDPLARLVAEEERAGFWSAVGRIPEKERHALLLRFSEEMTCAEVARTLGMTPNAVSCLLHRGKEHLRPLLAPRSLES
jgi:RNA polymerase sigma-70 factor (ECF subfamily)